jgi:hypothetical protein
MNLATASFDFYMPEVFMGLHAGNHFTKPDSLHFEAKPMGLGSLIRP